VGTGIRRNPEKSGGIHCKCRNSCPVGIPAKNSCESGEKQEFLRPPPKQRSYGKFLRKTQEKKKSSGILFLLFLSPKNKFLSNRNMQPSSAPTTRNLLGIIFWQGGCNSKEAEVMAVGGG
jgi:hypothetical protein